MQLKKQKHNCSLDALGFGSCDCKTIYIERKAGTIDADTVTHNKLKSKKSHDSNLTVWRKDLNRYESLGQDNDRWGSDEVILPEGSTIVTSGSERVDK